MKIKMISLIVCIIITVSCRAPAQISVREPMAISTLQAAQTVFDRVAQGKEQAWHANDAQVVADLFTPDAQARDRTFGDHVTGPDQIATLISIVSGFGQSWESRLVDQYIGTDSGLTVDHLWNLKFGDNNYTQDHPMTEVDLLQTQGERISHWTIFYSLEYLDDIKAVSAQQLEQVKKLLASYQVAWSSGDAHAVAELYATDALREDMLFMDRQTDQEAIASFAETFFSWYPDAKWHISLTFGEGVNDAPVMGGVYDIKVNDQNGQPCAVKAAVLLQTSENLITYENLYYEPQSLITCGWAR